jgi:metal-responsive CopG/Arc/MetJ family transcriptional regulator
MAKTKETLVRTTITIPAPLKKKMSKVNTNRSEVIREMISQRLEEEGDDENRGNAQAEAVILNEKAKREAPKNWNSQSMIKQWRTRERQESS